MHSRPPGARSLTVQETTYHLPQSTRPTSETTPVTNPPSSTWSSRSGWSPRTSSTSGPHPICWVWRARESYNHVSSWLFLCEFRGGLWGYLRGLLSVWPSCVGPEPLRTRPSSRKIGSECWSTFRMLLSCDVGSVRRAFWYAKVSLVSMRLSRKGMEVKSTSL